MLKPLHQITAVLAIVGACSIGFAQDGTALMKLAMQEQWKSDYLTKVSEFIYHYRTNKRMFAKWICLGKTAKFRERMNHPKVHIDVDPDLKPMAQYGTYFQTITLRAEPKDFFWSVGTEGRSSFLLWHEAIHAISHGHQNGSIKPSRPFKSAPRDVAPSAAGIVQNAGTIDAKIDHYYINWAEACIASLPFLERFEDILKANGKAVPPKVVQSVSRRLWAKFVESSNESIYGQQLDDEERKELEDMMGFHFDLSEILNGYLSLGYPMEYFGDYISDDQVWRLFPTAAQVGATGLKESRNKSKLDKISANYIKSWNPEKSGRNCAIHLTLFGSDEISKTTWDAIYKAHKGKKIKVPNVGDEAFIVDRGSKAGYHAFARFGNAQVFMTDIDVSIPDKGPVTVQRRAVNWNYVKRVFKNIEALALPPIPAGVETSIEKLRNSP